MLMYAMVDKFPNVVNNVNEIYMSGLISMSMVLLEIEIMWPMHKNRKLNALLLLLGLAGLTAFYFSIRKQAAVEDKQSLKSMIPYHSAAILMVEEA